MKFGIGPLYSANMFALRLFIVVDGVLATAPATVKGKPYMDTCVHYIHKSKLVCLCVGAAYQAGTESILTKYTYYYLPEIMKLKRKSNIECIQMP